MERDRLRPDGKVSFGFSNSEFSLLTKNRGQKPDCRGIRREESEKEDVKVHAALLSQCLLHTLVHA